MFLSLVVLTQPSSLLLKIQAKQAQLAAVESRINDKKATQSVIRNNAEKYAKRVWIRACLPFATVP
jgi:hypothetical protein